MFEVRSLVLLVTKDNKMGKGKHRNKRKRSAPLTSSPNPPITQSPAPQAVSTPRRVPLKTIGAVIIAIMTVVGFWNDIVGLRERLFPLKKEPVVLSADRIDLRSKAIIPFSVRNIGDIDLYQVAIKLLLQSAVLSVTNDDIKVEFVDVPKPIETPQPVSGDPFSQVMVASQGVTIPGKDTSGRDGLWVIIDHLPPKQAATFRLKNQSFEVLPPGEHCLIASVAFYTNTLPAPHMWPDGSSGVLSPQLGSMGIKSIGPGKITVLSSSYATQIYGADIVTNAQPLIRAGNWDEAEKEYTRAIQKNPSLGVAYANRTTVRLMKGNLQDAYQDSLKTLSLLPDDPLSHVHVAQCLRFLGRYDEALTNYSKALSLSGTNNAALIYERGVVLSELNRHVEARRDFDQSILLGYTNEWVYYSKGVTFLKENSISNAITEFNTAITMCSGMAESYYARGYAFAAANQFGPAARDLKEGMRLKPSLRTVDIVAAISDYEAISDTTSGREDVAISYFSKVITNNPMAYDAYNNRAVAYLKKGDIEKAMADYRAVTIIAPSFSFTPYFNLGMFEFNKGDITSAIPMFHESIKLNPEHAESHFYLAVALGRLGRLSESAPHLDTALKLKPSLAALLNLPVETNTLAQPHAAPLPRAP